MADLISKLRPWLRWLPSGRQALTGVLVLVVAVVGAVLGLLLGARTATDVGPFRADMSIAPAPTGETSVFIPPVGSLHMDTHDGLARLSIRLGALDQARTQQMITDPGGVARVTETVAEDVIEGVIRVGMASLGAAVLGAMLLAALVFRNTRRVAWAGGLALALVGGSLGLAAGTFRLSAVESPRYEGLLVHAPTLVGDVQRIADEYERYTDQLQRMVTNVSVLYTAASGIDSFQSDDTMTRVLHVSDLHLHPAAWSIMRTVVEQYGVDFIVDTGDIVDWGSGPENTYVDSIRLMRVPYVYVRGNHDSENSTEAAVAEQPNAIVLDDEVVTVAGLTVAGIGDPRFTPDQRTGPHSEEEAARAKERVTGAGAKLATTIIRHGEPVDIAAAHDPLAVRYLDGRVPLVLAGHRHERLVLPATAYPPEDAEGEEPVDEEAVTEEVADPAGTLLMVQASTGGAGLRGLEGEYPEPLGLSVLYFNAERQLVAYDDITVGGHGLSEASVQRHLIELPPEDFEPPEALDGAPSD
jgi:predicted phosphodiesterase